MNEKEMEYGAFFFDYPSDIGQIRHSASPPTHTKKEHESIVRAPFLSVEFYSFIGRISFSLRTRGVILTALWQLPSDTISLETPL